MKPLVHWSVRTWLGRLLLAMPVAQVLNLAVVPDPFVRKALSDLFQALAAVLGAVALTRAAVRLRCEGSDSAIGWGVVAAANWAFAAGAAGFMYLEVVRRVHPYPGFPDIFYIAFYPLMMAGLVLLPQEPVTRRERWNGVIDMAAYTLVAAMVIWHVNLRYLLSAMAGGAAPPGVRLSFCYTLLDALLLMVLFFRLVRRLGTGREFVPMLLLVVGGFFLIAADQVQGYMATQRPFASGTPVDVGWLVFSTMAGMAGVCIVVAHGDGIDAPEGGRLDLVRTFWTIGITYVWIGVVFAMLVWALFHPAGVNVGLLVAGVVGGTVLAVTRQVRTLREVARLYERLRGAHDELEVAVRDRTAELRASEQRFRAIFDSAYELIGLLSPDGTLLEANETALRIIGARREDVVGRPFWETPWWSHSREAQGRLREGIARAAQGRMHRGEEEFRASDGRWVRVDVTLKPVFDDAGRVVMIIPEGYDVTERKAAEEERDRLLLREQDARRQAEHASAAKDRFIAVLSHELRTPLTPVLMTLNVWREEGAIAASHREDLEMLIRNIQLEARMIDDLLDTTRVARGKLQLVRSACDLEELVRETAEMFRGDEGAAIEVEMPAGRIMVDADPVRVRQVVWNFLSNARKFTPREGRIVVRAGVSGGEAWVSVADNGVGIAPEQMAGLFDAFVQGAGNGARPQGLGLGLAISRAIARAHGGDVTCASGGVGKGAEFVLRLPALREEVMPSPPAVEPREPAAAVKGAKRGEGRSILLVEDHPDTARVLARLLSASGYEVRRAHTLAEARRALEGWTPDLVVSDLGLPDGSGHELMREVRGRGGAVKGIAVSGFGTAEDIQQSEEAGFARHLTKPVTPAALLETIGEMLNGVAAGHGAAP